ncbi:sugar ABC transporter ATP-binding protein [Halocella sp. SP3-1]|uniref:sugar ABC transporter ATP-binding protein n=1 Tax=Halocella sp. SP3-1 TaxID=2382161 RepID=UPI000F75C250|nr:sugar ABC transporter ATP-binding protein [Halocella sp. SP3-1]AZO96273.1 sugar ABC transporter ATP-binding protein [Halocella sp. SP3-1]
MKKDIILKVDNIYKSFGPTKALTNVSTEVRYGEIHGLIGENGSGKSTLSSIIVGAQNADSGEMYFDGKYYEPKDILDANNNQINMIVQEQGTVKDVTVMANVFVGKESLFSKFGILNLDKMYRETKKILDSIGVNHIDPKAMINSLSFEDRKLVEIARAMYNRPKLLIVDETTTVLDKKGRDILYDIMDDMRSKGKSIIFISHDIDELIAMCDAVTILRDGNITGRLSKKKMEANKIKQLMIGREISDNFYRQDSEGTSSDEIAIEVNDVSYGVLKNVFLKLNKGEILGIGGLTQSGMHELGKIMFGLIKPYTGDVKVGDSVDITTPHKAIDNKIGYVSKNRDTEALMTAASIKDNICLPSLDKLEKWGIIGKNVEKKLVNTWTNKLSIKMSSISQFCMYLSGGNKQKVSIAKWLANGSEIMIVDCPTRGIDVGVKSDIYDLMYDLKTQNKSILMISEELPELIGMSDRIIIFKDGQISGEFVRNEELKESDLINYMI